MSDKGKKKEIPIKEVEKEWAQLCSNIDKQLKALKLDPKATKELRKCTQAAAKRAMQEANKQAGKTKALDPAMLKPMLKKPPKEFFFPIRLEGVPTKEGAKKDKIKIMVGSKNLYLKGYLNIDDRKGTIQFDKSLMLMWKGTF